MGLGLGPSRQNKDIDEVISLSNSLTSKVAPPRPQEQTTLLFGSSEPTTPQENAPPASPTNNLIAVAITAVVQQTQAPAPTANTPATPSPGFDAYLRSSVGQLAMSEKATTATLTWQNIDADNDKVKLFKEQVLQSSTFTPFLAMTKGSHLISIIYGLTIYSAPMAIAALKDKAIGFTGNRMALREPLSLSSNRTRHGHG